MDAKPWYQSKTIWANILSGLLGIYLTLVANGVHWPPVPPEIITALSALGIYGRVTATTALTPS